MNSPAPRLAASFLLSLSLGCGARATVGGPVTDPDAAGVDVAQGGSDVGFPSLDVRIPDTDGGIPVFDIGRPPDVNVLPRDTGFPRDTGLRVDNGITPDAGTVSRTSVVAGRRCDSDALCASPSADLSCVPLPGGLICSSAGLCEQGTTAEEEASCGGRFSTCLVIGNLASGGQASVCTRACVPTATTEAMGACPSGSLCTTHWLSLTAGQVENPGCLPFCMRDSDCAGVEGETGPMERCNLRTGRCGVAPSDPAARADGLPCNPQEVRSTMVNPCRGVCFLISGSQPTQGLCGSLIDVRATGGVCADSPELEVRAPMGDNLGICIFRTCVNNSQCPAGLLCAFPEDASGVRSDRPATCAYATARQPMGIPGGATDGGVPPG